MLLCLKHAYASRMCTQVLPKMLGLGGCAVARMLVLVLTAVSWYFVARLCALLLYTIGRGLNGLGWCPSCSEPVAWYGAEGISPTDAVVSVCCGEIPLPYTWTDVDVPAKPSFGTAVV